MQNYYYYNNNNKNTTHTVHADVVPAVGLSRHVNSRAGVAPSVRHLNISYLQQPSLVQDLGTVMPRKRSSIFQPCDCWPWDALGCTLEGNVTSFGHGDIISDTRAVFDGRTN